MTNKQRLMDTNNGLVVTRGKDGRGQVDRDKGVKYLVMEELVWGCIHISVYVCACVCWGQ